MLILVDGSSYLFRAYHAMPGLMAADGQPTGAVYGVINMLKSLVREYQPEQMVVVFDAKGPTFRHHIYPDYKANRPPMPDELRVQIAPVHELVTALGLPLLVIPGVEADDVIATLSTRASAAGQACMIASSDKDLAQLVDDYVVMVDTMKNIRYDRAGVIHKYGVPPERIVDYLALMGDNADNIPGVPKVGPKTAARWLQQYGSLDSVVANADKIGGKVGENLRQSLDRLALNRELVTVRRDLELPGASDLHLKNADSKALRKLYSRLQFRTWLAELNTTHAVGNGIKQAKNSSPIDGPHYETILTEEDLDRWLKRLEQAEVFAFDTETTSLNAHLAELVGISFCDRPGEAAYVPIGHDYLGAPKQLSKILVLERLRPLLESPDHAKVGQNLKYDHEVLAHHGLFMQGMRFDTMLESYVLNSTFSHHNLDALALAYLGHTTIKFSEVAGKGKQQILFSSVGLEQAAPYAAEDADITLRLHQKIWPDLQQHPQQCNVFETIEMPLLPVLSKMERTGVMIDSAMLQQQSRELHTAMQSLVQQAYDLAGTEFNIQSPKQIQEVLFTRMGLPVLRKTPKGQPSTAEGVLQKLAVDYPLPRLILQHRSLSKLKSTYTDKLPVLVNPVTGRVHTSYHQAVASTGRLSSSDPNLQNIPVRSTEGRRIREAFIAEPGFALLSLDYSQVELRIMAHLSGDPGLVQAFTLGLDVHRATASEVFGVALDAVTPEQRRRAKAINFGLIYGMSAYGLARQLEIGHTEAEEYIQGYFTHYPGVQSFMEATRAKARKQGYVETLFGRRLYLPDINARNYTLRQNAERVAINAPMQGTAADLIKRAMIRIDQSISELWPEDVHMILQVHDELIFEIRKERIEVLVEPLTRHMTAAAQLRIPLLVDAGIGDNWSQAH
ncbi:MAG TPA: DNA polymerase I [Gammaproteobacteria bacterium]|nr:DNA polymerase I [Gammaproteobacteria bacterium]